MTVPALGVQQTTLWQIALAVGAVVIAVVIVLLAMLLFLLRSIDRGARQLQDVAQRVAERAHQTRSLDTVRSSVQELGQEAQRHAALLGERRTGP